MAVGGLPLSYDGHRPSALAENPAPGLRPSADLLARGAAGRGVCFGPAIPCASRAITYLAVATIGGGSFFFDWLFHSVFPGSPITRSSGSGFSAPPFAHSRSVLRTARAGPVTSYALRAADRDGGLGGKKKNLVRRAGNGDGCGLANPRTWTSPPRSSASGPFARQGSRPLRDQFFLSSSAFSGRACWAFVHLGSWEPLAFSIDRFLCAPLIWS